MTEFKSLPEAELEVMTTIWHLGGMPGTGLIKRELDKKKQRTLSAVQVLLSRLADRGYLSGTLSNREKKWSVLISREEYLRQANAHFLRKVNGDDLRLFLETLSQSDQASEQVQKEALGCLETLKKEHS